MLPQRKVVTFQEHIPQDTPRAWLVVSHDAFGRLSVGRQLNNRDHIESGVDGVCDHEVLIDDGQTCRGKCRGAPGLGARLLGLVACVFFHVVA